MLLGLYDGQQYRRVPPPFLLTLDGTFRAKKVFVFRQRDNSKGAVEERYKGETRLYQPHAFSQDRFHLNNPQ
jgi:hypothetical protein